MKPKIIKNLSKGVHALQYLLVLLLITALSAPLMGSHGRYGTVSYKNLGPVSPDSCAIEVTVSQAWEICAIVCHFPGPPPLPGDISPVTSFLDLESSGGATLSSEPVFLTVTSVNLAEGWYFGEYKTTMIVHCDSAYALTWDDCCRIFGLVNNSSGDYSTETFVTPPSAGNDSPVGTITPIVKLPVGKAMATFPVSAADPDGDPLFFRLATAAEAASGLGVNAPGFAVSPGGTGMIPTMGYAIGDMLNAWVAVEDTAGSKIILDFLIEITDSSAAPIFDYSVTPPVGPCIPATVGDSVKFMVKAMDPDSGDVVTISAVGMPLGAITMPPMPTPGGNPDSLEFCWVPGPGAVGATVIVFTAEDTSGVSTSTSVCILVSPDTAVVDSCIPVDVVCRSDSSWMKSTYSELGPYGGSWSGASTLPAAGTYTMPVTIGQPYVWGDIDSVEGSPVIVAEDNVTFYRKEMTIANPTDVEMRLRMNMDDGAEVYINGVLLVREKDSKKENWKNPYHDIHYAGDGTITNGFMGNQMFDFVNSVDLDTVLVTGTNEIVVAMRNLRAPDDRGGFSLLLEAEVQCPAQDSCVSDSTWEESTVITTAPWGGDWFGVGGVLPDDSTYTLLAMTGQPYPWGGMPAVVGSTPIKADNDIHYFRKCFDVTDNIDVDARIRMFMDDGCEVYLNGDLLVREENVDKANWSKEPHDILYKSDGTIVNGNAGNQSYDHVETLDLDTVLVKGKNTLVIALYNLHGMKNKGGFSFRLDMTKGGAPVIVPSKNALQNQLADAALQLYPNPASEVVNLMITTASDADRVLNVLDMNGRLLHSVALNGSTDQYTLDVSGYASGMYIVKVQIGEESFTQKLFRF